MPCLVPRRCHCLHTWLRPTVGLQEYTECALGLTGHRRRYYSAPPAPASCSIAGGDTDLPHITIIRPVKGLEPYLYECLAATFRQTYPRTKLTIYFCVSSRDDPTLPVLQRLLDDFSAFDVTLLVEKEDPKLQEENTGSPRLGPNPKIRNMSRAYDEAKGDIVWIVDCNVWVGKGVAGRMVDALTGRGGRRKHKFVHQLPLVVDSASQVFRSEETNRLLDSTVSEDVHVASTSTAAFDVRSIKRGSTSSSLLSRISRTGGGRLEELFMSSSHAKFYTAINTVLIAPCIVGKSNMFRRSHLNSLTNGQGIDFFSNNICEDHLIGDLLWKSSVPQEILPADNPHDNKSGQWGNHALVFGDLAIQPMADMSVKEYIARRVRWLRVRKFTVTLATLVEPGTESFLCSLYGAFAIMNLPWFNVVMHIPRTWATAAIFWLLSVSVWAFADWSLYCKLHSGASIEVDGDTPPFARPSRKGSRRPFIEWLLAWLGREVLAFPIWAWAVLGGVTVAWRGKKFWVGMDMKVHEIVSEASRAPTTGGTLRRGSKARQD